MSRDRSLDEFFSTSDDEGDSAASTPDRERENDDADETDIERESDDADETDTEAETETNDQAAEETEGVDDSEAVESDTGAVAVDVGEPTEADEPDGKIDPPRATYRWSPGGDECPGCGSVVEQRWRDGDQFVCADCKEW